MSHNLIDANTDIGIIGNVVNNAATVGGNLGIIRATVAGVSIIANRINGGTISGIYTATVGATVLGNYVSNGLTNISGSYQNNNNVNIPNGLSFGWTDVEGFNPSWILQSDDNHIFYGTNASGGNRAVWTFQEHSNTSPFVFQVPLQVASTFAQLGSSSGGITFKTQAAAGTYEWDWPTTAGSAGQVLTSQGGGGTAMTWTPISLTGTSSSIGGGALAAGACASTTVSVSNSTTGMAVVTSPVTYPGDGFYWRGYVSSAGTVTVSVCAAVAGTPTASAYNVRVLQ